MTKNNLNHIEEIIYYGDVASILITQEQYQKNLELQKEFKETAIWLVKGLKKTLPSVFFGIGLLKGNGRVLAAGGDKLRGQKALNLDAYLYWDFLDEFGNLHCFRIEQEAFNTKKTDRKLITSVFSISKKILNSPRGLISFFSKTKTISFFLYQGSILKKVNHFTSGSDTVTEKSVIPFVKKAAKLLTKKEKLAFLEKTLNLGDFFIFGLKSQVKINNLFDIPKLDLANGKLYSKLNVAKLKVIPNYESTINSIRALQLLKAKQLTSIKDPKVEIFRILLSNLPLFLAIVALKHLKIDSLKKSISKIRKLLRFKGGETQNFPGFKDHFLNLFEEIFFTFYFGLYFSIFLVLFFRSLYHFNQYFGLDFNLLEIYLLVFLLFIVASQYKKLWNKFLSLLRIHNLRDETHSILDLKYFFYFIFILTIIDLFGPKALDDFLFHFYLNSH